MKVITERSQIREIASTWRRQYPMGTYRDKRDVIYGRLARLDPETATTDDVAAIIGNSSWTDERVCHECKGDDLPAVVQLGEEPDCESNTAQVCLDCLRRAVALLEGSGR